MYVCAHVCECVCEYVVCGSVISKKNILSFLSPDFGPNVCLGLSLSVRVAAPVTTFPFWSGRHGANGGTSGRSDMSEFRQVRCGGI